jgi:hypothetical protein
MGSGLSSCDYLIDKHEKCKMKDLTPSRYFSYYVIQMISYMLVLPSKWLKVISKEKVIALSVPIVIASVWYTLHKLKRKWRKEKV